MVDYSVFHNEIQLNFDIWCCISRFCSFMTLKRMHLVERCARKGSVFEVSKGWLPICLHTNMDGGRPHPGGIETRRGVGVFSRAEVEFLKSKYSDVKCLKILDQGSDFECLQFLHDWMSKMPNLCTLEAPLLYLDQYTQQSDKKEIVHSSLEILHITGDWNRPRMRVKCLKFPRLKHLIINISCTFCRTWFCESLETITLEVDGSIDDLSLDVLYYYDEPDLGPSFRMKKLRKLMIAGCLKANYATMCYGNRTIEQLVLFLVEHPSVTCVDLQGCIFDPKELIAKVTAPIAATRKILFIFRLCKLLILGDVEDKVKEWMEGQDPKHPLIQIQLDSSIAIC